MSDAPRRRTRHPATLPGPVGPPSGIPQSGPVRAISHAERSEPVRAISHAERSEPIRVISMKDADSTRPRVEAPRAPRQVQLRAISEVANTPAPSHGRLAPPRDGRAARARQQRQNILWAIGGLILAAAIAVTIYLIAGR